VVRSLDKIEGKNQRDRERERSKGDDTKDTFIILGQQEMQMFKVVVVAIQCSFWALRLRPSQSPLDKGNGQ
jgi:hypothetical protein